METQQRDPLGTSTGFDTGATATSGAAGQAKGKAQQLVGQAQEQVAQRLSSGTSQLKGQASGALDNFAEAIRQLGQQFRDQNQGVAASLVGGYADRAAGQAQRLGTYLQHTEVDELVQQIERFARRSPGAFLGGAFAVGVLGARFLKSSRRQQGQRLDRAAGVGAMAGGPLDAADRDVTARQPIAREGAPLMAGGADAPPARGNLADAGLLPGLGTLPPSA